MSKSNKKILIVGGAGFIGSHLAEGFLGLGHRVIVIDDFSTAAVKNFKKPAKIYRTNVENGQKVRQIFKKEKPEIVYHLAGPVNLRREVDNPLFVHDVKFLERIKTILDCCRENKVKKIVFLASGGAIYGGAEIIPTPETYPAHPTSLYGLANLMIEKYIRLYDKKHRLNYLILRLSNVYGPRQMEGWIISSLIANLLKRKRPVINGDGRQTRDFVYVGDVVRACLLAEKKGNRKIYNVASNKETTLNQVFKTIQTMLGSEITPRYRKLKKEETRRSALENKKIKKELGWRPKINLKQGLLETVNWFKNEKPSN